MGVRLLERGCWSEECALLMFREFAEIPIEMHSWIDLLGLVVWLNCDEVKSTGFKLKAIL